jgi:peptide/nickel transport system permease protein
MKHRFLKYLLQRVGQCVLVIFVGITITFIIPRLVPTNPVEVAIARVSAAGQHTAPEAVEEVRRALIELYGLEGSIWQQYLSFWGRLLKADLGPSYSSFPTPVIELIKVALPWTAGLLFTSAVIAWVIGNFIGGIAGYFSTRRWARGVSVFAMAIRPIPYYIMAFVLLILFAYLVPIFPLSGALDIGVHPSFSLRFLTSLLRHAFLPSLSLVIVGAGGWILGMESLVSNIIAEDYVVYAKTAGVSDSKLLSRYVMRNALLPQVTGLALQVGLIFNGALITEYVFSYPGLGYLAYNAIFSADYSLIIGIAIFSIVGVAFAVLIVDLAYPLFDPRIQYR